LPGYLAEALTTSPSVTQGPYYPLAANIPLDKDNDLVQLNDSLTAAAGIVTYVSGRVLDSSGNPIRGALIELWHADNGGNYTYSASANRNPSADPGFAGFGQFLTGKSGAYKFRTVKAGLYNGRTRHYHFGVTIPGQLTRSTTQTFWNETAIGLNGAQWATQNSNDNVTGEVQAIWDYVSGLTPVEPAYPGSGSLVVAGTLVTGPSGGSPRFKVTIPAYAGYSYEIYGNPTLAELAWGALPFSLVQTGTIDRNIYTATSDGTLDISSTTAIITPSSTSPHGSCRFKMPLMM